MTRKAAENGAACIPAVGKTEEIARLRQLIEEGEQDIRDGNFIDLEAADVSVWLHNLGTTST